MENPEDRSARTLRAVSDIGQTMVSDADYEQVLAALIEKVCGLLDAESGGFMLYEPAAGELQLQRPAFGLDDDDDRIDIYRVPLSAGGNAVTVFLTGQPYFTNDAPSDPRCIQRYIELFDVEHVRSVLAHYKCPHAFNFVDELPKTATGKILRYKLRESPPLST